MRTLAEIALAEGWVDAARLRAAEAEAARLGGRLALALVELGHVREGTLVRALCRHYRFPAVDLGSKAVDASVLDLVPREIAMKHRCLPLLRSGRGSNERLFLGVDDPTNAKAVEEVQFCTCLEVRPVLVGPQQLDAALTRYYGAATAPAAAHGGFEEIALTQGDTAPLLPGSADFAALAPAEPIAEPEPAPPRAARPREVPTRRILQALTRVLLDKGVLTRDELLREVQALAGREDDEDAA
jgi:hypothetical protein